MAKKKQGVGWKKKPKGWTKDSIRKYMETMAGDRKHKVTKCIKELKGADWLDDPNDPGAFCASLADELYGTGWRKSPRKKSDAVEAITPQQLQTQKRYTEERSKGGPTTPRKQTREKPQKPRGGFKKWLLKTLNFPEEKEAGTMRKRARRSRSIVELSEGNVRRQLIARARARTAMAEDFEDDREEEHEPRFSRYSRRSRYAAPPVRRRRRSRFATETSLNREHNKSYDEPDAEDSAPWVEDDYADRPYSGPKPPKNVLDDSHVSAAGRRRIRAAMRRAVHREEIREEMEREALREEYREETEREAEYQSRRRPRRRLARRRRPSLRDY